MDKLQEAAIYYSQNLEGKKFHLTAGKNKKLLELDIVFSASNFKHLIGLHKLKDLPMMKNKSQVLYRRILNKEITYADIAKSAYLSEMEARLDVFDKMRNTLFAPNIMLKALNGEFKNISADFLLSKKNEGNGNLHLFLKNDKAGVTIPVTFFEHRNDNYLNSHGGRWTVLSVEEIDDGAKKHEQQQYSKSSEQKNNEAKLNKGNQIFDLVAATMEQCGQKIDAEIKTEQTKTTQKGNQQQSQQQVQQVGQARQAKQVSSKGKDKKKGSGKG